MKIIEIVKHCFFAKVLTVQDINADASVNGYKSGTFTYGYDANGNMIQDNSRGRVVTTTNILNLPQLSSITGGTVTITYDADGEKLRKVSVVNSVTTTTDYIDGIEYDNGVIAFIQTDEGLNTNAPTPAQVPYQPEHSDNYEIGWKNMLFNNKLKLNLTAFYLEQHNQQISTAMDGVNTLILNVGEMHNKGAELEVTALPVKGLQIDWNASYSHARYTSLLLYDATAGAVVNYKGDQPINTPPVTSMLAAQYTYDFSGNKQKLSAYVRGEYRYIDKFYFDFVNGLSQPAYNLFNAKAGITTKNYELNFWARNIFDKQYVAYGSFGTFLLGSPATYGITLIAKF